MEGTYGPWLAKKPTQVAVTVGFVVLFALCVAGTTQLKQDFSFQFFIPDNSYLQDYFDQDDDLFSVGEPVAIVTGTFDYFQHQHRLTELFNAVVASPLVETAVDSWYERYVLWASANATLLGRFNSSSAADAPLFYNSVFQFVRTEQGRRFIEDVQFRSDSSPTDGILASRLDATYVKKQIDDSRAQVKAMDGLRDVANSVPDITAFPYTESFIFWEQYAVIVRELVRNIALALVAVFLITLVLIAHPFTSLLVFLVVTMTIVDILGLMWAWGVPIDSVAVINLVLAIGLAVDYSAHTAHGFMMATGTNEERAIKSLADIGASVLNGAISTFLAVLVLAFSQSYIFRVFFKQFFGICVFGVFHGMMLLPILLMWWGAPAYNHGGTRQSAADAGTKEPVEMAPKSDIVR